MKINKLQELSAKIVDRIDKKYKVKRDVQLTVSQLVEELGELVEQVNFKRLRNKEPAKKDLESEFADVFLQLAKLADSFEVDLEKAILAKIKTLKNRHNLNQNLS